MTDQIIMYGTKWCGDCTRAKATLTRLNASFQFIDIEANAAASARARELSGEQRIPVVHFPDGVVLVEPSDLALRAKLE